MKKGQSLIEKGSNHIYQIVGRWDKSLVLMPVSEQDDQVLIYDLDELEGLVKEGHFRILYEKSK